MNDSTRVQAEQLGRMRGMTRYYHQRFFSDVRFTATATLVLFVVGWGWVPEAFLLIPVVTLFGASMTAFDASYLLFARHYAARLENDLNAELGPEALLAARVEDVYLFPLNTTKLVVAGFGPGFTWFGFMTLFITFLGVAAFLFGLLLGFPVLSDHGDAWVIGYLGALVAFAGGALVVGWWWFLRGEGERRLRSVLDT